MHVRRIIYSNFVSIVNAVLLTFNSRLFQINMISYTLFVVYESGMGISYST